MDVAQLKEHAARVEQGLDQLRQLHSKVGARLSEINQLDPANHPAEASSHESLLVHTQLSFLESFVNAALTQLSSVESGLSGAMDALAAAPTPPPANSSAAAETDRQPQVRRPSYRLVHRSSIPPSVYEGPARRRLSRDELSNVFGHLQPWELTPYRQRLGTRLFTQSAASYTNPVIDCEDDKARRMSAAMPLAVAQEVDWCLGTWNALVEGHASGRAAIAAKQKRRKREGGEETAAAAAASSRQTDDSGKSAGDGTLEVLSFESVTLDNSIRIPSPPPGSALPPAPTAPIHLPALKTVDNIPSDCRSARVGRQWRTPAVTTLIVGTYLDPSWFHEMDGLKAWVGGCEAIEVLDLKHIYFAATADLLSALPADGKSLAALHTLRGVSMDEVDTDRSGVDRLREVMVARGAKRSIRELKITVRDMNDDHDTVVWSESAARFIEAVAAPEVGWEEVFALTDDGTYGRIDAELLSLSSRSGTASAQKLIGSFAKTAGTVTYGVDFAKVDPDDDDDETTPAAIRDDAFAAAHTLELQHKALASNANIQRAVEIASNMPSLARIVVSHWWGETLTAPLGQLWRFLEGLQTARVTRGRGERSLSYLGLSLSANTPIHHDGSPCLWDQDTTKLPPIEEVHVDVDVGDKLADDQLETFYNRVMDMGHKSTQIKMTFGSPRRVEQPFLAQLVGTGLCKVSMLVRTLSVERRTPDT
ncbi:unnamed protein product [Vitrella brassicaformis CCMP3155]|uniref:Uncharacterized protein n=1 Tax=Vitrella brassicaformis (strain CCMP3155) TaxID=1169540 RepID=A0A0G4GNH1_VITBC|nr:unnamed protein product [Vitrella brassicaformis CCMP3155]|eukprot:CEM31834.1 unnamed protein product [Vitrella brassicaformis CCMP3155]